MVTPSSSSSLRMATDSVGWLTKQASAARPKWRSLATATTYFNSVKVIALLSCVNNPDAATSTVLHALAPPRDSVSDRKSTRLNSSHVAISYAFLFLKNKKRNTQEHHV